jgi:hypothetical protein
LKLAKITGKSFESMIFANTNLNHQSQSTTNSAEEISDVKEIDNEKEIGIKSFREKQSAYS